MGIQQMMADGGEVPITIGDQSISENNVGSPASAAYVVNSNGDVEQTTIGGGTSTLEQWIIAPALAGNYEVRATLNSGTLNSGTTGSWLNCGTTRSWSVLRSSAGTQSANLTIEIRNASTLVVRDSCTVALSATYT